MSQIFYGHSPTAILHVVKTCPIFVAILFKVANYKGKFIW